MSLLLQSQGGAQQRRKPEEVQQHFKTCVGPEGSLITVQLSGASSKGVAAQHLQHTLCHVLPLLTPSTRQPQLPDLHRK